MEQMTRYQVLAAAAAAFAAVPLGGSAQGLPKVRVSGVPTDDLVAVLYAVHSGAYQKAGLDVEYTPASSGTAATAAVVAGAYEIAKASPIASMLAYLRGLPLTALGGSAMWDPKHPVNLALVASDAPYHTGADLNGKIGASAGLNDINQLAISAWVDKTGGDSSTIKWVEIPNSATAAALRAHRVDIASMIEPEISDALAKGGVRVIAPAFSAIAPRFHIAVYNANTDWLTKNPDLARRWLQTTMDVGRWCNAHRAETIDTVAQATKIPADIIATMPRAEAATVTTNGPAYLQPLIDVAARYKNIPHAFAASDMFWSGR
jgi:NitT/TauT family transport system substrate-binding protein